MGISNWWTIKDDKTIVKRIIHFTAEIYGTAILVFIGCISCIDFSHGGLHPPSIIQISCGFGFAVMLSVLCFCHISGSHINPAVTLAAFLFGMISLIDVPIYWTAQVIGAILGFALIMAVTPDYYMPSYPGLCSSQVFPPATVAQGFLVEFLITFLLIWVCCGVWDPRNKAYMDSVALKFGFTIFVLALTGIPYTGASMNPARSLGPALLNGYWTNHWLFWLAPLSGSFVAAFSYRLIYVEECFFKNKDSEQEPEL